MSFFKISDPVKRDLTVKEFLGTKKNIRDDMISERTGEQQLQTDLSKFFKPITETQKDTAREITEELKPIKEGIAKLPRAIKFPTYPSIQAVKEPSEGKETHYIGEVAEKYLRKFTGREHKADKTYGLYDIKGKFYIGDKPVVIEGNDIIVDGVKYIGTPGLWDLIVSTNPKDYTDEDKINYSSLMIETNTLYHEYDPKTKRPRSSRSYKWRELLSPIWTKIKKSIRERGLLLFRAILTRC